MNVPFKGLAIGLLLGSLGGVGVYQASKVSARQAELSEVEGRLAEAESETTRLREETHAVERQIAWSHVEATDLRREVEELRTLLERVAALDQEAATRPARPANVDSQVAAWRDNVNLLKAKFDATPEMKIPELAFLDEYDWLSLARNEGRRWVRVSDNAWRSIMAGARLKAKQKTATLIAEALLVHYRKNNGSTPQQLGEVFSQINPPAGESHALITELLGRYRLVQMVQTKPDWHMKNYTGPFIEEVAEPADLARDHLFTIGALEWKYRKASTGEPLGNHLLDLSPYIVK